jgi:hypothetical protein
MVCLLCVMRTCVSSNSAVHPASHNVPTEMRELCVRPGMMWASRAANDSWGRLRRHSSLFDWRTVQLGRPPWMGPRVIPVLV